MQQLKVQIRRITHNVHMDSGADIEINKKAYLQTNRQSYLHIFIEKPFCPGVRHNHDYYITLLQS